MDMTLLGIGILVTILFVFIFSFVNLSFFQSFVLFIGGIIGSIIVSIWKEED